MESAEGEENGDGIKDNEEYYIEESPPTEGYIEFAGSASNDAPEREGEDPKEEQVYAYIDTVNNTIVIQNSILEYGDKLKLMNEDGSEFYVIVGETNVSDETAVISEEAVVLQTVNNPDSTCINDENLGAGDSLSEVIHDDMHKNDNSVEDNLTERENDSKDLSDNFDISQSTVWVNNASSQEANAEMVFIPAQSIVSSSQILTAEESKHRKLLLTHISQESFSSDVADSPLLADSAENSRSETDATVITKKGISDSEASSSMICENNDEIECTPSVSEDTECDISTETSNVINTVPQNTNCSNARTIDNAVSVIHSPSTYSLSSSTFTSVKNRDSELQTKTYDQSEDFTTNDSYPNTYSSDQAFCLDSDNKLSIDEDSNTTSSQTSGLDLSKDSKIPYSVSLQEDYFSENELKIVSDSPEISVENLVEQNRVFDDLEGEINENSNVSANDASSQLPSNIMTDNFKNASEFHENDMFMKSDSLTAEDEKESVTGEEAESVEEREEVSSTDICNNVEESSCVVELGKKTLSNNEVGNYEQPYRHDDESSKFDVSSQNEVSRQDDEVSRQDDEVSKQSDEVSRQGDEVPRQGDEVPRQDDERFSQSGKIYSLEGETSRHDNETFGLDENDNSHDKLESNDNVEAFRCNNDDEAYGYKEDSNKTSTVKVSGDHEEAFLDETSRELFDSVNTESPLPSNEVAESMDMDYSNDVLSPNYDFRMLRSSQLSNKVDDNLVLKDSSNKNSDSSCGSRAYIPIIPKKRFKSQPDIEKEIAEICESGNLNSDIINKIEEQSRALRQQDKSDCYNFSEEQNIIGKKQSLVTSTESGLSFHNVLNDTSGVLKQNGLETETFDTSSNTSKPPYLREVEFINSKSSNISKIDDKIHNSVVEEHNQEQTDEMEQNFNNIDIFDLSPEDITKPEPPRITYSSRKRKRNLTSEYEEISKINSLVSSTVAHSSEQDFNISAKDMTMEEEKTSDPGEFYISTGNIKVSANYTRKRKSLPPVVRELRTRSLRPRTSVGNESSESTPKEDINKDSGRADVSNASSKEEVNWGNYLLQTSFQSPPCISKTPEEKSPKKNSTISSPPVKNKRMKSTSISKSEAQWEKFVKSSSPKKTKSSTKKLREKVKNKVKKLCDSQEFNTQYEMKQSSDISIKPNAKRGRKRKISIPINNEVEQPVVIENHNTINGNLSEKESDISSPKRLLLAPKRPIPDDASVFICPHCNFSTRKVNNLIVHVRYCSHKEESLNKFIDYSVNDMDRRQRIRGETEMDSKDKSKHSLSNGCFDRDINEPSCSSASYGQPLDESDEDEAIQEKFGYQEKSVVYVEKDGRHFPAVIWCFIGSNVCVFLITSATTFEKLKVDATRLHKFDDAKWTQELLKKANDYPDCDNFIKAVQKCQSYRNKVCLGKGINIRQFFKIPEDESFSDCEDDTNSTIDNEDDSIIEDHIYLDTETSSEEDVVTDLKPKKIAEYILKGNLDKHVLSIYKEEIPNVEHSNFDKSQRVKRRADYNFGPFLKDENMKNVYDHLEKLFKKNIGDEIYTEPYIYKVWIPVVLIKALSVVKNISSDEALNMFYSIQVDSSAERERYLRGK